jgi:hypothetical protein
VVSACSVAQCTCCGLRKNTVAVSDFVHMFVPELLTVWAVTGQLLCWVLCTKQAFAECYGVTVHHLLMLVARHCQQHVRCCVYTINITSKAAAALAARCTGADAPYWLLVCCRHILHWCSSAPNYVIMLLSSLEWLLLMFACYPQFRDSGVCNTHTSCLYCIKGRIMTLSLPCLQPNLLMACDHTLSIIIPL